MDERDNQTFQNAEDVKEFLHSNRFADGFKQYLGGIVKDFCDAYPDEARVLGELLAVDVRVEQYKKRYQEQGVHIGFDEACKVIAGLTLWSPLPFKRRKGKERPEEALPYIYDYEKEAVKAENDKDYLVALIERSVTEKLAWDALQCLLNDLRNRGETVPDEIREWAYDVAGGKRNRPTTGRNQTTTVRDQDLSDIVATLEACGMHATANEASPPESACHAVEKVLGLKYNAVVKAIGRARSSSMLEQTP